MEISPTKKEIVKARSAAFGAIEDQVAEDDAKPIRDDLKKIAVAWAKLSDETKAQIEGRLDRDRDGWPDIGRAIEETMNEFGSPLSGAPPKRAGLRAAVKSLWESYASRVPHAGLGRSPREGVPTYPALDFVLAGVRQIWPEDYAKLTPELLLGLDAQLRALKYPVSKTPSKND